MVTDLVSAREGDLCIECGQPLDEVRGIEVGNIFKLGTRYSAAMGATFQDKDGKEKPVIMGSYGIGSGRLLASIAEEHNDDYGLIWPITVAPYQVHIVMLSGKGSGEVEKIANQLYDDLQAEGVEVLFDDRDESPGVKFNDADLIGVPLRLTIGSRGLKKGSVEMKRRDQDERQLVPLDACIERVKAEIAAMEDEIMATLVDVPFDE
jgi:prolyl-tRNA synthetase